MNATLLYRIAAVLLVLFAVGHTVGFLKFKPPSPAGVSVQEAMNGVQFQLGGKSYTYGMFYEGFGLFASAYLLFAAFLSWHMGSVARANPQTLGSLAWAFLALHVVSTVLSWRYFLLPPVVLSLLISLCTGWAAVLLARR